MTPKRDSKQLAKAESELAELRKAVRRMLSLSEIFPLDDSDTARSWRKYQLALDRVRELIGNGR